MKTCFYEYCRKNIIMIKQYISDCYKILVNTCYYYNILTANIVNVKFGKINNIDDSYHTKFKRILYDCYDLNVRYTNRNDKTMILSPNAV